MEISIQYPCLIDEPAMMMHVVHGDFPQDRRAYHCKALWDTGASNTTVATNVIKALGLRRVNLPPRLISTANGQMLSYAYEACMSLSEKHPPLKMIVWEMPQSDVKVLIGMDIIGRGRLTIDGTSGKTVLNFDLT